MWSAQKAVDYAKYHAHQNSQKLCGHYVTLAIRAGGISIPLTHHAKDMGDTLLHEGFYEVFGEPLVGDIAIIQPTTHHISGHACIYGGKGIWYSDFVQRAMYPGKEYSDMKPKFALYRHK